MCAITGFIKSRNTNEVDFPTEIFFNLLRESFLRGRDGFGYIGFDAAKRVSVGKLIPKSQGQDLKPQFDDLLFSTQMKCEMLASDVFIANHRAEPTTEYRPDKMWSDQQPYVCSHSRPVAIVHNGTIANDKELLKSHPNWQPQTPIDSGVIPWAFAEYGFKFTEQLQGSMAIAAYDVESETLLLYRNYQPLYLFMDNVTGAFIFSSLIEAKELLGARFIEIPFVPYSSHVLKARRGRLRHQLESRGNEKRGLVICSGGLDSTTVAAIAARDCDEIRLLHFEYNCKAQTPEIAAVLTIAAQLKEKYPHKIIIPVFEDMGWLGRLGGSSLTVADREIVSGHAGAEYAHEWVPARNTAMIGVAASYADRFDIGRIYLGLNLEESGAYPDNTTEFYRKFAEVLAVGTTARPVILNPLAYLMKHEIVSLALEIGAPIQYSWSCYKGGLQHCGTCGPCVMRRTAFQMIGQPDSVLYES